MAVTELSTSIGACFENDDSNTYAGDNNARRPAVNIEYDNNEINEISKNKNSSSIVRNPSRKNN